MDSNISGKPINNPKLVPGLIITYVVAIILLYVLNLVQFLRFDLKSITNNTLAPLTTAEIMIVLGSMVLITVILFIIPLIYLKKLIIKEKELLLVMYFLR